MFAQATVLTVPSSLGGGEVEGTRRCLNVCQASPAHTQGETSEERDPQARTQTAQGTSTGALLCSQK